MKIVLKGTEDEIMKWLFVNVGLGKIKDFKIISSKLRKNNEDNHEIVIDTKD